MEFISLYVPLELEEELCLSMVDIELLNSGTIVTIFADSFSCAVQRVVLTLESRFL